MPFPKACRRALRLRLKRIRRKIAKVEEEIAEAQGGAEPNPGLFSQEHPALCSLRDRLAQLREVTEGIERKLLQSNRSSG